MTRGEFLFSVTTDNGLEFQTFRSGGKGGQNQNKRETGVRCIHHPSGARGESREERSQLQNKRTALKRMTQTPVFKFWVSQEIRRLDGHKTIEQWVDAEMVKMDHFKMEVLVDGKWVEKTL